MAGKSVDTVDTHLAEKRQFAGQKRQFGGRKRQANRKSVNLLIAFDTLIGERSVTRPSLSIAEFPLELPVVREMAQFHTARSNDAALGWLREQFLAVASRAVI